MTRVTQRDWLEMGLKVLNERGAAGLTLDELKQRLGVTTGSFYHHFKNHQDYQERLLTFWEEEATLAIIRASEVEGTPRAILRRILELSAERVDDPEAALRAWATQNEQVRAVVERVDRQRIEYGHQLYQAIVGDDHQALVLVRLLYSILIGSGQMLPPLSRAEQWELIEALERLYAPEKGEQDAPSK